jgi:hypothetical protein
MEDIMTPKQAAKRLGCTKTNLNYLIRVGYIKAKKVFVVDDPDNPKKLRKNGKRPFVYEVTEEEVAKAKQADYKRPTRGKSRT